MKIYTYQKLTPRQRARLCARSAVDLASAIKIVRPIIDAVRSRGDSAVQEYSRRFDKVWLKTAAVSRAEIVTGIKLVPPDLKIALRVAVKNITKFHRAQKINSKPIQTTPGVTCWRSARAIDKVGLYIPGGSAPLPSTVLMLGIPARLANCSEIILCTPPRPDGVIDPTILCAAALCGITKIFKVGGAQAIAAMAYGTKTIPKVYKIFGPGNQFVTAAKQLISIDPSGAAIDMPAGPSEVMVIADNNARVDFVAADLLSQAEHGPDSQVVLICTSSTKAKATLSELKRQLATLPRRSIAEKALNKSFTLVVKNISEAINFANAYAPEHLILNIKNPNQYLKKIINAGSVFVGPYTPESAGDYASGTNHTLPTSGYARVYGGVSLDSFRKYLTFQTITLGGAKNLGPTVATIAAAEGLTAHQRAMEIRYKKRRALKDVARPASPRLQRGEHDFE